jgi:hypothetical protein
MLHVLTFSGSTAERHQPHSVCVEDPNDTGLFRKLWSTY